MHKVRVINSLAIAPVCLHGDYYHCFQYECKIEKYPSKKRGGLSLLKFRCYQQFEFETSPRAYITKNTTTAVKTFVVGLNLGDPSVGWPGR